MWAGRSVKTKGGLISTVLKASLFHKAPPPFRIVPMGRSTTLFCFALVSLHLITTSVQISETRTKNLWQLLWVNGCVHKNLGADSQRRIKNSSLLIIFIYADVAAIFLSRIGTTVGTKEQRGEGNEELILSEDLTSGIGLSWQMTSINEGLGPRFVWRQRFLPKMWRVEWQLDKTFN